MGSKSAITFVSLVPLTKMELELPAPTPLMIHCWKTQPSAGFSAILNVELSGTEYDPLRGVVIPPMLGADSTEKSKIRGLTINTKVNVCCAPGVTPEMEIA